jgi:predicted nuclease of predicted toxin-antitoxin system
MRLCANENIPGDAVQRLRADGHEVWWVRESTPGIGDLEVLERAVAEQRLLVTFDKDFGELVFRHKLAAVGLILFRIGQPSAAVVAEKMSRALASREDWAGHFSVIDDQTIRMRRLG